MPVHMLSEAGGRAEAEIPNHLQRTEIKKLTLDSECEDKYIKEHVVLKYPLNVLPNGRQMLKAVIQEHVTCAVILWDNVNQCLFLWHAGKGFFRCCPTRGKLSINHF
ncbi:protection of telomeres protein 1 isoform X1 [Acipenser oxyrinchus oxyrinchus]|uniref:Protection of telomeres protein 1 isoform X1 n=1 Tax=Acipenser oxyrinchus oxyrinchus TaxID=40147 RepID=A0AAD8G7G0_ACIOX|nr:protection of telomeres protein 1 isoform X1 [Acipenser oxyrinchus oxyrinchus]